MVDKGNFRNVNPSPSPSPYTERGAKQSAMKTPGYCANSPKHRVVLQRYSDSAVMAGMREDKILSDNEAGMPDRVGVFLETRLVVGHRDKA